MSAEMSGAVANPEGRRLACGHLVARGRWVCCWPDGPGVEQEKCQACAIRRGDWWHREPGSPFWVDSLVSFMSQHQRSQYFGSAVKVEW